MKTVGLLSDTHGYWDERFATHFAGCDEIWHAGDIGDIDIITRLEEIAPVRAVCGNIDYGILRRSLPEVQEFEIEGLKVWMTHIGGYPGKYSPGVTRILREKGIGLMVAGHSHILKVMPDHVLNLLHINPGAAGLQGWQRVRTIIKAKIDGGSVRELDVIELNKMRIS